MDFDIISKLCQEQKITIPELSEKIGMSRAGLYTTLKNKTLTVSNLEKIAEALNVPITVFFKSGSDEDIELIKKELELSKQYYTALEKNYESLKEINELIKKNADSATREAAANYNIICMIYVDLFHLNLVSYDYIERKIISEHPEFENENSRSALDKYVDNDEFRKEILSLINKIRPMIKGEVTFRIDEIKEID